MSPHNEEESSQQPHKYDTSLKDWVAQQAPAILPLLVPGITYERTLKSEIIRSVMRADKVFKVQYYGKKHILHLEFQTSYDNKLPSRLLVYNAVLHHDHGYPVLTIVVYPFSVPMAIPPFVVTSHEKEIVSFDFKTLPLFTMDAEACVAQHQTCLYPLVPTMHGVHADLMVQVIKELSVLYRDEKKTLSDQFAWMMVLLDRNKDIPDLEKYRIEERLKMFNDIWEESPLIQKVQAQYYEKGKGEGKVEGRVEGRAEGKTEGKAEGKAEGRIEGEVQAFQRMLIKDIQRRFPELTELAQKKARLCSNPDTLETLFQQLQAIPDVQTAQLLLTSIADQQG